MNEVIFVGGGPENGVSSAYLQEMLRLADLVRSPGMLDDWWSTSPLPTLELWMWFDRDRLTYRTRRSASKMTAQIERSARSTRDSDDPLGLAQDDLANLLNRVADKLGLGAPPPLS